MGQTQKPKQVLGQGSLDPLFSTLLTIEGEAPDWVSAGGSSWFAGQKLARGQMGAGPWEELGTQRQGPVQALFLFPEASFQQGGSQ